VLGAGSSLLDRAGIPPALPSGDADPGILRFEGDKLEAALESFTAAITRHRHFERETDPPVI
jgi:catalase